MKPFSLARAGAKFLAPIVLLFGGYLTAVGADAPGGGFAAALAFALGVVLYALVFGVDAARAACPIWLMRALMSFGVLGLIALGAAGAVRGYNFLDYRALLDAPGLQTQRTGILLAQGCMLATAAGAFVLGFFALASRAGDIRRDEW